MKLHTETQGSPEWAALRSHYFTASNAAAMMGCHPTKQRNELLCETKTGIVADVSDFVESRVFEPGHATEAAARPLAEAEVGEDLYPIVGSLEIDGLPLLASFDGLTMDYVTGYEHKLYSEEIAHCIMQSGEPPMHHVWQLEQQLLVSGGKRILFVTSDGTPDKWVQCWYTSKPERRAALIAGWQQFAKDLAAYVPKAKAAPVVAAPVETLPAVSVKVEGALVIASNLPDFGTALRNFIAKIPEQPSTDQEFADTEAACKALKRAEEALEAAESNALAQLSDVDTMRRFVADFKALARTTRLQREKLVTQRKEAIKSEVVAGGVAALAKHIRELNAAMPANYMPSVPADFGGAIKGLRTVDSIRNAVDTELARAKIAASEIANRIHANLGRLDAANAPMLFAYDMQALVLKQPDDLAAVIAQRLAAEQQRKEAERARILAEEKAREEREAEAARKVREAAEEMALKREQDAAAAIELASAKASDGAELSPAAQALNEAEGAARLAKVHPTLAARFSPSLPTDNGARLTLGQINERLAPISVSVVGLSTLGFEPVAVVKAARMYRECDFGAICRAISEHVLAAAEQIAEAA